MLVNIQYSIASWKKMYILIDFGNDMRTLRDGERRKNGNYLGVAFQFR